MEQNEDALEYSSEDEKKDNLEDNLNKLKVGYFKIFKIFYYILQFNIFQFFNDIYIKLTD